VQKFGIEDYKKLRSIGKRPFGGAVESIRLRPLAHPFYVRPGTPDASVVIHAMAREAYSYMLPAEPIQFIIDAGANIGDTSVWYATRFPNAQVVAIEPNSDNLAILRRNCAPYGEQIRVLEAALWPVPNRDLSITGHLASAFVQESETAGALTCPSIDPLTVLRDSGREVIDIFKIDIEGAELKLFSGACDGWLSKTRNIAIEIHSNEAREAVFSATKRNGFRRAQYRDLYVFWR
jgi:FkbM family methyltransferase